jgi:T5SS/PEP-CTERM-associated repeat protein
MFAVMLVTLAPAAQALSVWLPPFGDWFESTNWHGGTPVGFQAGVVDSGLALVAANASVATPWTLTVGGSDTGQVAGVFITHRLMTNDLTVGDGVGARGLIQVSNGGILDALRTLDVGKSGNGTINVLNGSYLNTTSTAVAIGQEVGSVGTVNLNGGVWTMQGRKIHLASAGNGTLALTNGGALLDPGMAVTMLIGERGGHGTVSVSGGALLQLDELHVLSSAELSVSSGGKIETDHVSLGAGQWHLDSGGSLRAFETATFADATMLQFTLDRQTSSGSLYADKLSLDGTLTVAFRGNISPFLGESFDLMDWNELTGQFDTVNLPALKDPRLFWDTSMLYTTGEIVAMGHPPVPVPEPTTTALLLLGLGAVAAAARRRRFLG